MSILAKYSLWLLGILTLAAGCITGASLWFQRSSLTQEEMLRGQSIVLSLAAPAADAFLSKDTLLLVNLANSATHDNPGLVYAALLDDKGVVQGHPDASALGKPLDFTADSSIASINSKVTIASGSSAGHLVWDFSVPIKTQGEQLLGTAHIGLAQSVVQQAIQNSLMGMAALSLAIMVIGVGLTFLSLRVLVTPLSELAKASASVGGGDLDITVPVRSKDEIGRLASNFNSMIAGLKRAESAKIEQGRIEGELNLAHTIQEDLLPHEPPQIKQLDVAFSCISAKELGGDFYDCIELRPGSHWGFLIADVSGKGVPAALHMANLRNLFRIFGPQSVSPAETLKKVNAMAYADMKAESFVTLIYIVVDLKTLQATMVNAGHDPAYCLSGGRIQTLDSTAAPVGIAPADVYDEDVTEESFQMKPGDLLFTFTDGITEAMNSSSEQFSLQRLKAVLLQGEKKAAKDICADMLQAVQAHADGADQSDDITMLAVKAV